MLPLPDSLLERSFYSQLEINSPSSSNQAPPPNFPFVYPSPAFFLEGFPAPPPPPGPPINSRVDAANLESIQLNLNTTTNNSSKRVARKDRHSKINTAAGLRDRRMRLSLDVARKFFDLQDMLGFDKASKTVQWLLTKSKTAIKEITGASRSTNSDNRTSGSQDNNTDWAESDCEDGSTVSDYKQKAVSTEEKKQKVKKSSVKAARKSSVHQAVDKESRAKARERARERTKEKNRLRWVTIASSIAVESSGEGSGSRSHGHANYTSTNNLVDDLEKGSSSSVHRQKHALTEQSQSYDHFPVGGDGSTNMPLYDYTAHEFEGNYNNFSLYQGQWGMEGLQFAAGMQYHSRPW